MQYSFYTESATRGTLALVDATYCDTVQRLAVDLEAWLLDDLAILNVETGDLVDLAAGVHPNTQRILVA